MHIIYGYINAEITSNDVDDIDFVVDDDDDDDDNECVDDNDNSK